MNRSSPPITALAAIALFTSACEREPPQQNPERTLEFRIDAKRVGALTVHELTRAVEPRDVEVFEPYEQTEVGFEALPLQKVFDEAYGPRWREHEAVVFTCRDGYQPTIPVRRIRNKEGFLAIERRGDVGFSILKYEEGKTRRVSLEPFYIIWENLDDAHTRSEGDYGWPYQVVSIDLVSFRSRFGTMTPPEGATPHVLAGFEGFVVHCSKCHAINGHGGEIGPELNYPANPTEYMKGPWLRKWIADPESVRLNPRMPPLNPDLVERDRVIDEIVAYLQTMARHKVEPGNP